MFFCCIGSVSLQVPHERGGSCLQYFTYDDKVYINVNINIYMNVYQNNIENMNKM